MLIGSGQLAKTFTSYMDNEEVCIFASGVSNSNCTDIAQFEREKKLLLDTLRHNKNKKIVYFSSCALSANDYPRNSYYKHKAYMEKIIKQSSNEYYIFRLPQLFGDLILHKTLINFIYKSIMHNHRFNIYNNAYRYVIEINDVKTIVDAYLKYSKPCISINLSNPYRYKVLDIVKTFEELLNKKATYELIEKDDKYLLDLSPMQNFIQQHNIDINFGPGYFADKLKEKLF